MKRPVAIDLFAGAGGLTLGFEQAGFDVVASVEYDPVHAAVHAFNFPLTETVCADVSKLSAEVLRDAARSGWNRHGRAGRLPDIDVIFGGPPCQGFSFIGKRLVDDRRNQLVFHFFRIIAEVRPKFFVMENVPGMLAGGHSGILAQLIQEFESVGYSVVKPALVMNAADFGVPQDRRRMFLFGARKGQNLPRYPLPTVRHVPKRRTGGRADNASLFEPRLPDGPTVLDALGDLPDLDRFEDLLATDEVRLSLPAMSKLESQSSPFARQLRSLDIDPCDFSQKREWDPALLTSSMRTEHTALSIARFAATEPGQTEPVSRFYRLDPYGLCNTLRAGTGSERGAYTSPRPIHPIYPRVISVREAARIHSFPDWFRLHRTKWHGFRQVGNSVPPLLGRAIARQIVAALRVRPMSHPDPVRLGDPTLLSLNMSQSSEHFGADADQIPAQRNRDAASAQK